MNGIWSSATTKVLAGQCQNRGAVHESGRVPPFPSCAPNDASRMGPDTLAIDITSHLHVPKDLVMSLRQLDPQAPFNFFRVVTAQICNPLQFEGTNGMANLR
jgi:hypothetical protein